MRWPSDRPALFPEPRSGEGNTTEPLWSEEIELEAWGGWPSWKFRAEFGKGQSYAWQVFHRGAQGSPIFAGYWLRTCSVASVVSDSLQSPGPQASRLLCPWSFSGKNTGVGCRFPPPVDLPNPGLCLLHCRRILYLLSHRGSPDPP